MATMLDIAGGIVIGGFALGVFYVGLIMALSPGNVLNKDANEASGVLLMLLSGGFCAWLVFWRTGIIPNLFGVS